MYPFVVEREREREKHVFFPCVVKMSLKKFLFDFVKVNEKKINYNVKEMKYKIEQESELNFFF
jgi:hypothetical protein